MEVRLCYTFGGGPSISNRQSGQRDSYTTYERQVSISNGGRVLIVDDILGVGSVLYDLTRSLKADFACKYIRAFCVYSLGDIKDAVMHLDDVDVDYLVAFPDVVYRKELAGETKCEFCKDDPAVLCVEE